MLLMPAQPIVPLVDWRISWVGSRRLVLLLLWLTIAACVYLLSFPAYDPHHFLPFALFILYYTALYLRLLAVPFWSEDTLEVLEESRRSADGHVRHVFEVVEHEELPHFIVMIAAFKSEASIGSVLHALDNQRYPADKYEVYVITQEAELHECRRLSSATGDLVERALRGGVPLEERPATASGEAVSVLTEVLASAARDTRGELSTAERIRCRVVAASRLGWTARAIAADVREALLLDFLERWQKGMLLDECMAAFAELGLEILESERQLLRAKAERGLRWAGDLIAGFHQVLGLGSGPTLFSDPHKPIRVARDWMATDLGARWVLARLFRRLRPAVHELVREAERRLAPVTVHVAARPDLESVLRRTCESVYATCPEEVSRTMRLIDNPRFHHVCRAKEGGGKPESLNAGYESLMRAYRGRLPPRTLFLIIDADSLLHSAALATTAREVLADGDFESIRQVAPLSTSNFQGNNVFGKLVSCLDTIGSTGKWAWNTRAQLRPDLPAGSGIVVPLRLIRYLDRTKGTPWEAKTITEDARMVITDYGLMDGASRKTKFVPTYLLEAVPQGSGILATYRQYWAQRMRWASGGPDEIIQLVRSYATDRIYDGLDPRCTEECAKSLARRIAARLRQTKLLVGWTSDHLWWGWGFGLAPVVWISFSFFYVTPPFFTLFGLVLFLGVPALVVFRTFRRFATVIPGPLAYSSIVKMYVGGLLLGWFLTLPIIYTHLLYVLHRHDRFRTWTTTAKPRF
jgi:cellulose synthase/poly-beta-1,6-N-acetylglucosamine synthase-like glycosyltransferase